MDRTTAPELEKISVNDHENGSAKEIRKHKAYSDVQTTHLPFWRQAFIASGTFMLSFSAGATAGFPAILIPQLQHEKGHNKYSTEMVSWLP
ncbi:uncharacterized protein [Maniola hyperantus]|uniref:uncharacterized protein isoform X4 n=1 Tax=Aphantopus hyperantus TaxID=2795564 RepID=UPI0037479DE8